MQDALVVQIDRGPTGRWFATFECVQRFQQWYATLDDNDRTIHEVITSDNRKLVLDIDGPHLRNTADLRVDIGSRIRYVFIMLDLPRPDIVMYDSCGDSKLSYHVVVSNLVFSASTCMGLCLLISYGQVWEHLVDKGVYKRTQNMRIEGSTKYGERRWKRATRPVEFSKGLLSVISGLPHANLHCAVQHRSSGNNKHTGRQDSMSGFKIRKRLNNMILLDRVKPGFCVQCNRVHTRENAFVMNNVFNCWRAYNS